MKKILFFILLLVVAGCVQAQTDCERMLNAAKEEYDKGKYEQARKQFKMIQEDCGPNYGGAADFIKKCNNKLQEDKDFKKCTTIESCNYYIERYPRGRYIKKVQQILEGLYEDEAFEGCTTEEICAAYLEKYPNGRHVTQVKEKLSQLVEERLIKEEDEEYAKCSTKVACMNYLEKYPNGRYEAIVRDKLWKIEDEEAYAKCTTELACDNYLKACPKGRYWDDVMEKKAKLMELRLRREIEAEKTAYMKIRTIVFANVDSADNVIDPYVSDLYDSEMKYLKPKIIYDGILDESKFVNLNCKIINPKGEVSTSSNSSYTYSNSFWVRTGTYNSYELSSWGNSKGGSYKAGEYKFELWYNGNRIYQTSFTVKAKETALSRGNWRDAINKCKENVTRTLDNGIYKGQLVDGSRSGLGMYAWTDGTYYIGRWQSGSRNGMGMYISPSSGYHVRNCPDCVYYVGGWSNSTKSGTGTCYDKLGNLIYYGPFDDDKPTQSFTGSYDHYKFECIEYSNGNYYLGETLNGKRHGKGIMLWSSGDMWYGDWKSGERDGYGIYMSYNGSVSTGTWKGDTKQ